MKTYVAGHGCTIESTKIEQGAVVGKGDIARGEWVPEKGLEALELGHAIARLQDGRIVEQPAKDSKKETPKQVTEPKTPDSQPAKDSKKETPKQSDSQK